MVTYSTPQEVGVEVGSIFYSSWGYDQTNVDFYEVVALTPKGVKVKSIAKKLADDGTGVVAIPGSFSAEGKGEQKRLQSWSSYGSETVAFNLTSYSSGYLWDGKPKFDTIALGYCGH